MESLFQDSHIECFLCAQPVTIKVTKKAKPYWVCNGCGVQVFIRGQRAADLLANFLQQGEAKRPILRRMRRKVQLQQVGLPLKTDGIPKEEG